MTPRSSYCRGALPRWQTDFGKWVREVGVRAIVSEFELDPDVRCTPAAVYKWVDGHEPRPERARALVALSRGALTLEMVYSQRREIERLRRDAAATTQEGAAAGCR